jgi:hypothetical protein
MAQTAATSPDVNLLHQRGAIFSADRRYRFALSRRVTVAAPRYCAFCLLNPSTADEQRPDATVRKCLGFSERWGFSAMDVVNVFPWGARDPSELRTEPGGYVHPENDEWILAVARNAELVVLGWGHHGQYRGRGTAVRVLLQAAGIRCYCLGFTKAGDPLHPLFVPYSQELQPVPVRGVA